MNPIYESKKESTPLWQDKGTLARTDVASGEASYDPLAAYSEEEKEKKHHGSQKRRLREVSGCIEGNYFDRLEIIRHAGIKGKEVSRSSKVGEYVKQGILLDGKMNWLSILEPILERVFAKKLEEYFERFLGLEARNTKELARVIPMQMGFFREFLPDDVMHKIEVEADKAARVYIKDRSKEVKEVADSLKGGM